MSNEYLKTFQVGSVDCLTLGDIEETDTVLSFLNEDIYHVVPRNVYNTTETLNGVLAELSEEYSTGYYLTCINTYLSDSGGISTFYESPPDDMSMWEVPYNGNDSYTFVITDIPFQNLLDDNTLINGAFIKAFGVKFTMDQQPTQPTQPTIPPDAIWDGGRTFIIIRDSDTFEEKAKAYDLMNTRIYEEINNKYTLDFNILPYENVWMIMHPNFLEINGDYFRIRTVEKSRTNTLMMSVSCEHISYELNVPYEQMVEAGVEMPEEMTLSGTPTEILEKLLGGSRFSVGTVHFNNYTDFSFKFKGFRSLIIEFANFIGAEVKWEKFTVSLLLRRGTDRDLTFEVGKNLIGMTETFTTTLNGGLERSYEVDVIDLSRIGDQDIQEEMYDIRLGDTVSLLDEQFGIDVNRRIVSYEIDPFRKELPRIQLDNPSRDITNVINDTSTSTISSTGVPPTSSSGEVLIELFNSNSFVCTSEDDPEDFFNWMRVDKGSGSVVIKKGTDIVAGLKLQGEATTLMIVEGVVKMVMNTVDNYQETVTFYSSEFKSTVNSGFYTIGIPFAITDISDEIHASFYVSMKISDGTFEVPSYQARLFIKGKNIEWRGNIS